MLRISIHKEPQATRFKVEGRLALEWVREAAREWSAFVSHVCPQRSIVDLCGVLFVDQAGKELLTRMASAGAKLEGCGPMMNTLIEEISGASQQPRIGKRMPSFFTVFFISLLIATLIFGYRVMNQTWSILQVAQAESSPSPGKVSPQDTGAQVLKR